MQEFCIIPAMSAAANDGSVATGANKISIIPKPSFILPRKAAGYASTQAEMHCNTHHIHARCTRELESAEPIKSHPARPAPHQMKCCMIFPHKGTLNDVYPASNKRQ